MGEPQNSHKRANIYFLWRRIVAVITIKLFIIFTVMGLPTQIRVWVTSKSDFMALSQLIVLLSYFKTKAFSLRNSINWYAPLIDQ